MVDDLDWDATESITSLALALNLTLIQARIVAYLMTHSMATVDDLRPYGASVQQSINRARTRLSNTDKTIWIETRYGLGYSLSVESRMAIQARVGAFMALTKKPQSLAV